MIRILYVPYEVFMEKVLFGQISNGEALKKLSVYICIKHNIKDILPHKELGNTLCPGKNFPLEEIKNDVIKELKKMK